MLSNPWLSRRVLLYAHQGGALEAPSSTLFAFTHSVELGCEALEMDVHMTADGILVLSHDETIDATANSTGSICDITYAELKKLDNAFHFCDEDHPGEFPYRGKAPIDPVFGFARLEEVLEQFPAAYLNFDIKQTNPTVAPYERQLALTLRHFGRSDDVIVASFHDSALEAFREFAPEIHTSLGPTDSLAIGMAIIGAGDEVSLSQSAVALQLPTHFGENEILTAEFIAGAHERGLAVHAWTIDTETEMRTLLDRGIDGIMTDRPSVGARVLTKSR